METEGWNDWMASTEIAMRTGDLSRSPYAHERVTIYRPEWPDGPQTIERRSMPHDMNVFGLLWLPAQETSP